MTITKMVREEIELPKYFKTGNRYNPSFYALAGSNKVLRVIPTVSILSIEVNNAVIDVDTIQEIEPDDFQQEFNREFNRLSKISMDAYNNAYADRSLAI